MKLPETQVKFLNNGDLLRWYEKAVTRKNLSLRWEIAEEMARRVYPHGEMMPNIKNCCSRFPALEMQRCPGTDMVKYEQLFKLNTIKDNLQKRCDLI